MINYIKGNLFDAPDATLAHCISADFALGAGIAKEFNRRFDMRRILKEVIDGEAYWGQKRGYSLLVVAKDADTFKIKTVFNLVTKQKYWQKPTLQTLRNALEDMKSQIEILNISEIAIPKIGCGLDKLQWKDVEGLLLDVLGTDIKIDVYSLE